MIDFANLVLIESRKMISLSLAVELKNAGLVWNPALHDLFAIPDSDLDQRVFVVSDMAIDVERLFGQQAITFNGAVEWSLDHIMVDDVVWMPTEEQLREALQQRILGEAEPAIRLNSYPNRFRCMISLAGELLSFEAHTASDAYGLALLHIL
jgi:hypothetical protein